MGSASAGDRERSRLRTVLILLGGTAAAAALAFGYVFFVEPTLHEIPEEPPTPRPKMASTAILLPGVDRPPAVAAAEAGLEPDAEVIGVVAGGRARAYARKALHGPTRLVVNDVLDQVPVTVTYCDRTDCLRVFTGPAEGKPLPFGLGGWDDTQMIVRYHGRFYLQSNGRARVAGAPPLPCPILPAERTTWATWRAAHPDTDVCVTIPAVPPPQRPPQVEN